VNATLVSREFPAMPEATSWSREFKAYAKACSDIIDRLSVGPWQIGDDFGNALIHFEYARKARDYELIAAYTRFLMHGVPVYDIKNTHNTLKEMHPGTPVWSEITADHLNAYAVIFEAFGEWSTTQSEAYTIRDSGLLRALTKLCFEDLNIERAKTIAVIISRGIVDSDEARAAIDGFSAVTPLLVDGAL
jgi:hypothetical protein